MFRQTKSNSSASEKLHRIVEDAPSGVTETQKRLVLSTEMRLLPMGFFGASYGHPKACSPRHYEYSGLSAKSFQTLRIQWFERQELLAACAWGGRPVTHSSVRDWTTLPALPALPHLVK